MEEKERQISSLKKKKAQYLGFQLPEEQLPANEQSSAPVPVIYEQTNSVLQNYMASFQAVKPQPKAKRPQKTKKF